MAQIGTLTVDLLAQTASFNSNIEKAARNLNSNAARMNRSVAGVQKQLGFLGNVAKGAAGALAGLVTLDAARRALDYAGSLGEVAQQLGVTTRDLQVYRYAASQVGISQEEMDAGLARLTRSLGQAASGAKAPARAFNALGIDIRDANGSVRDAGSILPELADQLSRIPDPAKRAALEVAIFGKTGQKLDTLLAGGRKQIGELTRAAEELGLVLSSSEIQQADDAADKLAAVKTVLEANIARVVANNADSIIKLANSLVALAAGAAKFMAQNPGAVKAAVGAIVGGKIGGLPLAAVGAAAAGTGGFDNFGAQVTGSKIIYEREGVLGVLTASRQELIAAVAEDQRRMQAEFNRLNALRLSLPEGSPVRKSVAGAQAEIGRNLGLGSGAPRGSGAPDTDLDVPEFLAGGGAQVDAYGQSLSRLNEQLAATKLELQAVNENWPDSQLDAARLRQQLYNDIAAASPDITAAQRAELTSLADALVEQERALTLARMSQDIATNSAERYAEVIQGLTDDVEAFNREQAEALFKVPEFTREDLGLTAFDKAKEEALQVAEDFSSEFSAGFARATSDILMGFDSIGGAARRLLADTTKLFQDEFVIKPLFNWVKSNLGDPVTKALGVGGPLTAGGAAPDTVGTTVALNTLSTAANSAAMALSSIGAGGLGVANPFANLGDPATWTWGGTNGSAEVAADQVDSLGSSAGAVTKSINSQLVPAIGQAASALNAIRAGGGGGGGFLGTLLNLGAKFASSVDFGGASLNFAAVDAGVDKALSQIQDPLKSMSGFATGGLIGGAGSGTSDSIAAWLSNGEFVINAVSTRKWLPVLEAINAGKEPRFAAGGLVGGFSGVRAAMRDVQPANDRAGGPIHFHYHGDATREDARRFAKQSAAEHRRELARSAAQGIG